MAEHPMLFSGEMVRAILDGRKSQTRRVMNPQPPWDYLCKSHARTWIGCTQDGRGTGWKIERNGEIWHFPSYERIRCPYGQPGDQLWVRETWWPIGGFTMRANQRIGEVGAEIRYRADNQVLWREAPIEFYKTYENPRRWKPSIHMFRWASRITLEVTGVRVERVQEINQQNAKAEGCCPTWQTSSREMFMGLWDSLNAKRGCGWDANPWVWAIQFRLAEPARRCTDA